ncbi:MAG: hypothetical protein WAQ27_04180 [Candidatus Microsaccharimonas sp.]
MDQNSITIAPVIISPLGALITIGVGVLVFLVGLVLVIIRLHGRRLHYGARLGGWIAFGVGLFIVFIGLMILASSGVKAKQEIVLRQQEALEVQLGFTHVVITPPETGEVRSNSVIAQDPDGFYVSVKLVESEPYTYVLVPQ